MYRERHVIKVDPDVQLYIQGLIPRNSTELAEAVPIGIYRFNLF